MDLGMSKRVTIQKQSTDDLGGGAYKQTWEDDICVWASVRVSKTAHDYVKLGITEQDITTFVMRKRDISTLKRLTYDGEIYKILTVADYDKTNTRIIIKAITVKGDDDMQEGAEENNG